MAKVICTAIRGDRLVVWHDGYLQDRRMVSPVELCYPLGEDVEVVLDRALGNMLVEPEPDERDVRIAELEAENAELRGQLDARRAI